MATTFEDVAVGGLPSEVASLGRPDAVFPAKRFVGTGLGMMMMASGILMLFCAGAAVFAYLNVPFPKDGPPPEIVLGVGAFGAVFGLVLVVAALSRPAGKGDPNAFRGFLVYPTALVRVKDGQCTIVLWDQVVALINPEKPLADFQILAADGRKFPVDRPIEGYLDLLGTILYRLRGRLLERARTEVASGQTVTFGPFGVSRDAFEYKGKKLAWDQMSVFEVMIERGGHRRLRIKSRGTLWPWCYALLYGLPNEAIFFELIEELRSARPAAWY